MVDDHRAASQGQGIGQHDGAALGCGDGLTIGRGVGQPGRLAAALAAAHPALTQLGIDMHTDALHVTVRAVPLPLRQQNLQILIPELIGYLAQQNAFDVGNIAQWMARNLTSEQTSWNMAQAIALLADVERLCPQLVRTPPGGLLQPVDLHSAMNALKDE